MTEKRIGISIFIGALIMFAGHSALADRVYTTDEDFDLGTLVDVNHDEPNNNQLQLDTAGTSFVFVNVAASGRGTIVRIDAATGDILGEYRTAPDGRGLDPSRTSVDSLGNVWTANRDEAEEIDGVPHGSVVKIGLIIGGRRVTINESGEVAADPAGQYLEPPFEYSTCIDRDEDGLIKTSRGLGDILPWPEGTDGAGGTGGTDGTGIVEDADDECILLYQRLSQKEKSLEHLVKAVEVGDYRAALERTRRRRTGFPSAARSKGSSSGVTWVAALAPTARAASMTASATGASSSRARCITAIAAARRSGSSAPRKHSPRT